MEPNYEDAHLDLLRAVQEYSAAATYLALVLNEGPKARDLALPRVRETNTEMMRSADVLRGLRKPG